MLEHDAGILSAPTAFGQTLAAALSARRVGNTFSFEVILKSVGDSSPVWRPNAYFRRFTGQLSGVSENPLFEIDLGLLYKVLRSMVRRPCAMLLDKELASSAIIVLLARAQIGCILSRSCPLISLRV